MMKPPPAWNGHWNGHFLDALSTAVLLFDDGLRLRSINAAGQVLLSLSPERAQGQPASRLLPGADRLFAIFFRALEADSPYVELGVELQRPNDAPLILDCVVTPVFEQGCKGLLAELVNAAARRRAARDEAMRSVHAASNEAVRQVAHEVKNPLAGIRGAAQLLQRDEVSGRCREYLDIIVRETDRLNRLVDRMSAGARPPLRQRINIHEVLEHVYGLMQAERPPGVELHRDYDPSLPEISADREQLVQVLLNVGRNALQAVGGQGEVRLCSLAQRRCTIGSRMHRLGIRVDVIDTGPGLPPGLNHTAFYPMVSGRPGGTGLGLPIAQALVQAHGGVLQYERLGEETIFSLLLPPRREP